MSCFGNHVLKERESNKQTAFLIDFCMGASSTIAKSASPKLMRPANLSLRKQDTVNLWQDLVDEVLKNAINGTEIIERLKPQTKMWILDHILPAPQKTEKEVVQWVLSRKASVIVAHGEKPIQPHSLLLGAIVKCLIMEKTPPRFMFFNDFSKPIDLSSTQIKFALLFLGHAQVLLVLSEFQVRGIASIVKEMQDGKTRSTYAFGILLFGSGEGVDELATEVFYDVHGVILAGSVPLSWLYAEEEKKNVSS